MSKLCKNCGAWQDDNAKFCEECGNNLANITAPVEAEVVNVVIEPPRRYNNPAADAREVRERLIGTKTEYYLPHFERMETLNSFTSWNWAAFFFGTSWMLYRKMYVFGIVLIAVSYVLSALDLNFLSWVVTIGIGVLGNFLYMKDIDSRTEKAMNMQPEEREVYIRKNSGTSWVPVLICFAVSFALGLLFAL